MYVSTYPIFTFPIYKEPTTIHLDNAVLLNITILNIGKKEKMLVVAFTGRPTYVF